jgi:hypothetical protein
MRPCGILVGALESVLDAEPVLGGVPRGHLVSILIVLTQGIFSTSINAMILSVQFPSPVLAAAYDSLIGINSDGPKLRAPAAGSPERFSPSFVS